MPRTHAPRIAAPSPGRSAPLAARPWGGVEAPAAAGHDFARVSVRPPAAEPVVQRVYQRGDVDDLATAIRNGDSAYRMRAGLEHLKRFDPADHAGMINDLQAHHPNEHTTYTNDIAAATRDNATVDQDRGVVFAPGQHAQWTPAQIAASQQVMDRLPRSHLSGVSMIGREAGLLQNGQPVGGGNEGGRTVAAMRTIALFDRGVNPAAHYRIGGEQSEIGGHGAANPVSTLDEVLTHEIGHTVEAARPNEFAQFQQIAGWTQMNQAQAQASLSADSGIDAGNLGPTMATIGWGSGPRAGRHQYNAKGANYFRRELGMMPGDTDAPGFNVSPNVRTPVGGGPDLSSYSRFSPKEHFAEMYAQMVHTPERVFEQHVEQPLARQRAARDAVTAAETAYSNTSVFSPIDKVTRYRERSSAREALTARNEQASRMGDLWHHMRRNVFGVTRDMESAAHDNLLVRAAGLDAAGQARVTRDWAQAAPKAATPWQLQELRERIATTHGI